MIRVNDPENFQNHVSTTIIITKGDGKSTIKATINEVFDSFVYSWDGVFHDHITDIRHYDEIYRYESYRYYLSFNVIVKKEYIDMIKPSGIMEVFEEYDD